MAILQRFAGYILIFLTACSGAAAYASGKKHAPAGSGPQQLTQYPIPAGYRALAPAQHQAVPLAVSANLQGVWAQPDGYWFVNLTNSAGNMEAVIYWPKISKSQSAAGMKQTSYFTAASSSGFAAVISSDGTDFSSLSGITLVGPESTSTGQFEVVELSQDGLDFTPIPAGISEDGLTVFALGHSMGKEGNPTTLDYVIWQRKDADSMFTRQTGRIIPSSSSISDIRFKGINNLQDGSCLITVAGKRPGGAEPHPYEERYFLTRSKGENHFVQSNPSIYGYTVGISSGKYPSDSLTQGVLSAQNSEGDTQLNMRFIHEGSHYINSSPITLTSESQFPINSLDSNPIRSAAPDFGFLGNPLVNAPAGVSSGGTGTGYIYWNNTFMPFREYMVNIMKIPDAANWSDSDVNAVCANWNNSGSSFYGWHSKPTDGESFLFLAFDGETTSDHKDGQAAAYYYQPSLHEQTESLMQEKPVDPVQEKIKDLSANVERLKLNELQALPSATITRYNSSAELDYQKIPVAPRYITPAFLSPDGRLIANDTSTGRLQPLVMGLDQSGIQLKAIQGKENYDILVTASDAGGHYCGMAFPPDSTTSNTESNPATEVWLWGDVDEEPIYIGAANHTQDELLIPLHFDYTNPNMYTVIVIGMNSEKNQTSTLGGWKKNGKNNKLLLTAMPDNGAKERHVRLYNSHYAGTIFVNSVQRGTKGDDVCIEVYGFQGDYDNPTGLQLINDDATEPYGTILSFQLTDMGTGDLIWITSDQDDSVLSHAQFGYSNPPKKLDNIRPMFRIPNALQPAFHTMQMAPSRYHLNGACFSDAPINNDEVPGSLVFSPRSQTLMTGQEFLAECDLGEQTKDWKGVVFLEVIDGQPDDLFYYKIYVADAGNGKGDFFQLAVPQPQSSSAISSESDESTRSNTPVLQTPVTSSSDGLITTAENPAPSNIVGPVGPISPVPSQFIQQSSCKKAQQLSRREAKQTTDNATTLDINHPAGNVYGFQHSDKTRRVVNVNTCFKGTEIMWPAIYSKVPGEMHWNFKEWLPSPFSTFEEGEECVATLADKSFTHIYGARIQRGYYGQITSSQSGYWVYLDQAEQWLWFDLPNPPFMQSSGISVMPTFMQNSVTSIIQGNQRHQKKVHRILGEPVLVQGDDHAGFQGLLSRHLALAANSRTSEEPYGIHTANALTKKFRSAKARYASTIDKRLFDDRLKSIAKEKKGAEGIPNTVWEIFTPEIYRLQYISSPQAAAYTKH
ncbi:hypothetical protein M3P05_11815 [Sansalvadorimonas sp. 2012CJ34-2]|uniref:Uncharacterized protein n=1 Tax=Parendozoicomonas callyspongiae TaxID=2942213 RepID=A0ABT0PHY1_9GAMM|nr:hypothetical protein [Sansalvadorimonas sp. 2012CJ34-2]MCL6270611.1 hypothetical protein [Sansalvadorimonas sp. 2012CJ34-2]